MIKDKKIGKLEIQLRYSDTDQMGVIYHANYFSFFEQARTQFLRELGFEYSKVEEDGIIFPVRDVSCTYLKPIRFKEPLAETLGALEKVISHLDKKNEISAGLEKLALVQ